MKTFVPNPLDMCIGGAAFWIQWLADLNRHDCVLRAENFLKLTVFRLLPEVFD